MLSNMNHLLRLIIIWEVRVKQSNIVMVSTVMARGIVMRKSNIIMMNITLSIWIKRGG